jgi:hypothetical protein
VSVDGLIAELVADQEIDRGVSTQPAHHAGQCSCRSRSASAADRWV